MAEPAKRALARHAADRDPVGRQGRLTPAAGLRPERQPLRDVELRLLAAAEAAEPVAALVERDAALRATAVCAVEVGAALQPAAATAAAVTVVVVPF